jgi:hypothetical protein
MSAKDCRLKGYCARSELPNINCEGCNWRGELGKDFIPLYKIKKEISDEKKDEKKTSRR